ncbi:MAG: MerC domain-containing protein [Proteobacteria bacterium]|nr:MerC domain-containing protein [Pseudomonadota bacterium]
MQAGTQYQQGSNSRDRWGIAASTMCALHCILGPVLAASAGTLSLFGDERIEIALAVFACGIVVYALQHAYSAHRSLTPAAVATGGIAVLGAVRTAEFDLEHAEMLGSVAASMLLVAAHVLNTRELRRAACCGEAGCMLGTHRSADGDAA